ncbi:MAG: hypothetical protein JNM26_05970 [Ideonella sp.]|nr:hypothetical protein [Ideonella sp.]
MTRHQDTCREFRVLVDTVPADDGRHGHQVVVDGKRPPIGVLGGTQAPAITRGVVAARAKIDDILGVRRPAQEFHRDG